MTLHAVWSSSGLHVWGDAPRSADSSLWAPGERPPTPDAGPAGDGVASLGTSATVALAVGGRAERPLRRPAGLISGDEPSVAPPPAGLHPSALDHAALRDAVGELTGDGLLASSAHATFVELFLPHDATGPVVYGQDPVGPSYLLPVRVPALRFTASQVADLLQRVGDDDLLSARGAFARRGADELTNPDLAGPSLSYFARLFRYVLQRIGLKQFYPDLDQIRAGTFVGVWRVLTHEPAEAERLSRFAATMPPVVRACIERGGAGPGGLTAGSASARGEKAGAIELPDPARIVDAFVSTVADAFIRRAVSTDPFFTRVHGLAGAANAGGDVRFLSALLGSDPTLRGGSPESNQLLCDDVHRWVQKLDRGRSAEPWKLVFSLREPTLPEDFDAESDATDGGDLVWRLLLQLRSPGEDGLLVDAESLWDTTIDPTGLFGRGVAERKAQLTQDLLKAAELCPMLGPLARSPAPSEMQLSTLEAHTFIRNAAAVLRTAGFGVELPEWADRRERGLGLMLTVSPFADDESDDELYSDEELALVGIRKGRGRVAAGEIPSGQFGLESLLEFDWQIAVGNLRLTPEEFKALAQRNSPLVRYRGQWLQIDPDASARAGEFLARSGKGRMTLAQALRTAYGVSAEDTGLPVIGLTGRGWIESLLAQTPAFKLEGVRQPPAFAGTLRPYQLRGLEWMCFLDRLGLGGCLADDMGLGKTVQLISLLLAERTPPQDAATHEAGEALAAPAAAPRVAPRRVGPTLLFAPTSVVGNWMKELQRFAPSLKVLLHHGPVRLSGDAFVEAAEASDVVITSYALAHRDIESLRRPRWHRLALDEAQKIKNPAAAATVAIRSIRAPRRIALTGTPIENHLSELWSIMELLNPGLLGSATDFRERFAVPIEKLGDKDKAQQLRRMIQPFVLRRTKNDPAVAGDLPEKMEMKVYCNLSAEQAALYERITAEMLGQIDAATGIRRRGLILAALTRLKQVCDHPILLENDPAAPPDTASLDRRSGKCERLLEMLEEVLQEGDAALVFTQYREMGHLLERLIQDRLQTPVQFLHGGTSARQRDAMIERFQDPAGGVRIFILSLRAGGLGLNLTAANHVFHFDRWWNPAVEQQATDRAHRIGQTRKVQVHQFICVGTLEERIDKLLTDKLLLADQVVGSGDEWLTDLSTEQLRQYLSLGRDAVGDF